MLNSHCNNNDKKICSHLDANPYCSKEYVDLKSTILSTRLRSPLQIIDKNICYMQQFINMAKLSAVSVNNGAFFQCLSVLICSNE